MTKKMHAWSLAALPLAIGLASFSGSAGAVTFNIGDVNAQLDSQLSLGISAAASDADRRFVDYRTTDNGLPTGNNLGGQAVARTSDDGRLNYSEKGDVFSKIFRGVHDLELSYGDSGAFFRGKYWYDFETKDGSPDFYDIDDSGRDPLVKGSGVALLDAFVYHNYFIGNNPGNVRLGRQVVSWGESTFIQNSINSINPVDVAALRRPGAEIKEGLLPVEMLYLSQGLTENLSMEAFYQLKWQETVLDNCGTFFGADTLATGCNDRLIVAGLEYDPGNPVLSQNDLGALGSVDYIVRARKDKQAKDEGQFGVAFRYFAPELNDSEFGFYAMNYHSRTPIYSNIAGRVLGPNAVGAFGGLQTIEGIDGASGPAGYFFEYPEDIRLYGLSFQTSLAGASIGGEFSYRPNMPLQINTGDMSRTALLAAGVPVGGGVSIAIPGSDNTHRGLEGQVEPGDYIQGYERKEFYQAQVTVIKFFDRVLGASRLSLVGEAGVNYIGGLGNTTKFGRDSLFGQSPYVEGDTGAEGTCASVDAASATGQNRALSWCENDGFMTSWSSGYRVRAGLDYSNVFAGINLSPNVTWSHDVDGYGPNFSENAKAMSFGLNADYANKYNASISYTDFFDGKYNTNVDRDFVSASVSVSF
ncbi:DUF1302 domain-containing protein [Halopseudomonas sp.]|uniref:DUF1302 domain-containing protein n=1 Tax=Halopseudomonas sp. TaxID=2901191 RepID=UPI003001B7D7